MAQDFLKPTKIPNAKNFGKRETEDGRFHNPPTFSKLGGFTSSGKWKESGKMSLERGGPQAVKGRPI